MNCPHCGLINPPEAIICDCGYNFESKIHGEPIIPGKKVMKRTTAQRLLMASGILALLGGGSCFLSLIPLDSGDAGLGWAIIGGLAGIGALAVAIILGVIGLIVLPMSRRDSRWEQH